jgi:ankyrin repeat protein
MGIGLRAIWNTLKKGDVLRFKKTLRMTRNRLPSDEKYVKGTYLVIRRADREENKDGEKYIAYDYYETKNKDFLKTEPTKTGEYWTWDYSFFSEFFELVFRNDLEESLNEKFKEESDPIDDLGIGLSGIVKKLEKATSHQIFHTYFKDYFTPHTEPILKHVFTDVFYYTLKYIVKSKMNPQAAFNKAVRLRDLDKNLGANIYRREFIAKALKDNFNIDVDCAFKKMKESVNEKFEEESDPIHSMGIGMERIIKDWIEKELNMDYNAQKKFLLDICATHGKLDFIKYLVETGVKVKSPVGNNALKSAAAMGYLEIVKYLLEKGADPKVDDSFAMRWAAREGHYEVVKVLLEAGAYARAKGDYAFKMANNYGHKKIVKLLSQFGADPYKHVDVKESLSEKFEEESDPIKDLDIGNPWKTISRGDIVHNKRPMGWSGPNFNQFYSSTYAVVTKAELKGSILKLVVIALHDLQSAIEISQKYLDEKIGYMLWEETQDINTWSKYFILYRAPEFKEEITAPLDEKFEEESDPIKDLGIGMRERIIKFLKEHGEYREGTKEEMLRISCIYGKPEFVEFLIADGVNIHTSQDAPLRQSAYKGCIECMKLLLEAGADINALQGAALLWAVQKKRYESVEFLLKNGADVNINDGKAIREACSNDDVKMAKILFDHGADIHAWHNWILKIVWGGNSSKQMNDLIDDQLKKEDK